MTLRRAQLRIDGPAGQPRNPYRKSETISRASNRDDIERPTGGVSL